VNFIVNSKQLANNLIVFGKHVYCKQRTKMLPQSHFIAFTDIKSKIFQTRWGILQPLR